MSKFGLWSYSVNSKILGRGEHAAKSQTKTADGLISPFSETLAFIVGNADTAFGKIRSATSPRSVPAGTKGDVNGDGRVNITDFSILLFFWGQQNPKNAAADINGDGIVNIFDFSIMLFWWSG